MKTEICNFSCNTIFPEHNQNTRVSNERIFRRLRSNAAVPHFKRVPEFKCHGRFSFVLEDLFCFTLGYNLNPEGTSDLL